MVNGGIARVCQSSRNGRSQSLVLAVPMICIERPRLIWVIPIGRGRRCDTGGQSRR